jgi:hypothetical protein
MLHLVNTLQAWEHESFIDTLGEELNQLDPDHLPLQQCLSQGSHVLQDEDYKIMLLNQSANSQSIRLTIGIFFSSVIAGCSCADDPTPLDTCSEYGELLITIDRQTAVAQITAIQN